MDDRDVNVLARKLADALDERDTARAELEKAREALAEKSHEKTILDVAVQDAIAEIRELLGRLIRFDVGAVDRAPIERTLRSLVEALEP